MWMVKSYLLLENFHKIWTLINVMVKLLHSQALSNFYLHSSESLFKKLKWLKKFTRVFILLHVSLSEAHISGKVSLLHVGRTQYIKTSADVIRLKYAWVLWSFAQCSLVCVWRIFSLVTFKMQSSHQQTFKRKDSDYSTVRRLVISDTKVRSSISVICKFYQNIFSVNRWKDNQWEKFSQKLWQSFLFFWSKVWKKIFHCGLYEIIHINGGKSI